VLFLAVTCRPAEIGFRQGNTNTVRQTTELSRVKARIKALAEKTVSNGCTEAEAMAAADMVGRLLERYALSMEEIDVREERCVQVEVPIGGKRRRPIVAYTIARSRGCAQPTTICENEQLVTRPPSCGRRHVRGATLRCESDFLRVIFSD
jgi:hypothetical protein